MRRFAFPFILAFALFSSVPVALCLAGCTDLQAEDDLAGTASAVATSKVDTTAGEEPASTPDTAEASAQPSAPDMTDSTEDSSATDVEEDSSGAPESIVFGDIVVELQLPTVQVHPGTATLDSNLLKDPKRYEENHPYLLWYVPYSALEKAQCSGGTYRYVWAEDTQIMAFGFEGTGVRLIANTHFNLGRGTVRLAGAGMDTSEGIDLYSAKAKYQQEVWYSGYLPSGRYLVILYSNPQYLTLDAIDVWGTLLSLED